MNIMDISTQLLYTTVPIVSHSIDTISQGTGFFFSINRGENTSIPFLVTNYHVLEGTQGGYMELHIGKNGIPTDKIFTLNFDSTILADTKLGALDLVAIPFAGMFNKFINQGVDIFFKSVDNSLVPTDKMIADFAAIEDVTFIGYPNAIYDRVNKSPIIRQGITATPIWNDFNSDEVFLIDAGVFPGSSGSPVFIYNRGTYPTKDGIAVGNRLIFVGVISQNYCRIENGAKDALDLGIVINSKAMYREIQNKVRALEQKEE